jgi:hypothetical protein
MTQSKPNNSAMAMQLQDDAAQALAALAERVRSPQAMLYDLAQDIEARTDARFSSQRGPDGQAWARLSKATLRRKKGRSILFESGDMQATLQASATAEEAVVSVSQPYAGIHQFGGVLQRAARQGLVRHRTNARGELLRSALMNGKGLVFAKKKGQRHLARQVEIKAHQVRIPARPFLPVRADGSLYPDEQAAVVAHIKAWLLRD